MKHKIKLKNLVLIILLIIFIFIFIFSSLKIIKWYQDGSNVKKQTKEIISKVKIETKKDTKNTIIVNEEDNKQINNNDENLYYKYIKMDLMDADISSLKSQNDDVVGWLKVNGTNINYPFVQTDNNDFYLTHDFNKRKNACGWVFMDYRNNVKAFDKNTIIYAHGRADNIMFGTLKNVLSSSWQTNTDNYVIKLSNVYENTLWQIFSVYKIPTTNDYLKITFVNDAEFKDFTDKLIKRSTFNFNTSVSKNDKILTLSTCYNDQDKMVVHAKLIKYEEK